MITKQSSTPLRPCQLPKLCLFGGGERGMTLMNSLLRMFYIALTRFSSFWQLQYLWFLGTGLSQLVSGLLLPLSPASSLAHSDCPGQPVFVLSPCACLEMTKAGAPGSLSCWLHCPSPFPAFCTSPASGTISPLLFLKTFSPSWLAWHFSWFFPFLSDSFSPSTIPYTRVPQELVFGLGPTLTLSPKAHIFFHSFHSQPATPNSVSHSVALPVCWILRHSNKVNKGVIRGGTPPWGILSGLLEPVLGGGWVSV